MQTQACKVVKSQVSRTRAPCSPVSVVYEGAWDGGEKRWRWVRSQVVARAQLLDDILAALETKPMVHRVRNSRTVLSLSGRELYVLVKPPGNTEVFLRFSLPRSRCLEHCRCTITTSLPRFASVPVLPNESMSFLGNSTDPYNRYTILRQFQGNLYFRIR